MTDELPADTPVTRDIELDITLDSAKPVGRVEVRRIRMRAGTSSGLHVHNGPVFGTILRGSVAFESDGETVRVLEPGDVFYEAEGATIARFDALDDDVEFIGVFPLEPEQDAAIVFPG